MANQWQIEILVSGTVIIYGQGRGGGSRRIVSQWNLPDFSPPLPASALCSISMIPLISHQFSVFPLPPPLILYKRRLIPLNNNYSLR